MLTLAIDTSGKSVSVALLESDEVLVEEASTPESTANAHDLGVLPAGFTKKVDKGKSKSKRVFPPGASVLLAPMIQSVMEKSQFSFADIRLVVLPTGPGLFTGLRVGVVTAKSICYSTGAELLGVNTLEVMAAQAFLGGRSKIGDARIGDRINVLINAQRGQVFSGVYEHVENWAVKAVGENQLQSRDEWLASLTNGCLVAGTGLRLFKGQIEEGRLPLPSGGHADVVALTREDCGASSVGKVATRLYLAGMRSDLWKLQPLYFRPSSAEEVRQAKLNAAKSQ